MEKEDIIIGLVLLTSLVGITALVIKLKQNNKEIAKIKEQLKEID